MNITVDLDNKQKAKLKVYRKFLNRTHGTTYADLQELLDGLTDKYLKSLVNQMKKQRGIKVSKAYSFATEAKQNAVDNILGVTDEE